MKTVTISGWVLTQHRFFLKLIHWVYTAPMFTFYSHSSKRWIDWKFMLCLLHFCTTIPPAFWIVKCVWEGEKGTISPKTWPVRPFALSEIKILWSCNSNSGNIRTSINKHGTKYRNGPVSANSAADKGGISSQRNAWALIGNQDSWLSVRSMVSSSPHHSQIPSTVT